MQISKKSQKQVQLAAVALIAFQLLILSSKINVFCNNGQYLLFVSFRLMIQHQILSDVY